MVSTYLPHPLKIEVVVLDGDFPSNGSSNWTSEEFDSNIVKERTGKRPLLAGDCLTVTLRDGFAPIGEIEFTDNSSWIRSRKFRLGARVAPGSYQGVKIREAITEAFVVKDHRGECKLSSTQLRPFFLKYYSAMIHVKYLPFLENILQLSSSWYLINV